MGSASMNNPGGAANTVRLSGLHSDDPNPGVKTDSSLTNILAQQQANATNFRNNIGNTESRLGAQAAQAESGNLSNNLRRLSTNNASRGLLYGGINAGERGMLRAQSAGNLARARSNINQNVESTANQLDTGAVNTAVGIQQNQQAIDDAIYREAMYQQASDARNQQMGISAFSSFMSAGSGGGGGMGGMG